MNANGHNDKGGRPGKRGGSPGRKPSAKAFGGKRAERADVLVVGAGASGLSCAITAARAGRHVLVLEADAQLGRSIKRTGDGRCNIANAGTGPRVYRNAQFVAQSFAACSPAQALEFLESCGIVMRTEAQGRMYPQANKATSVVDALLASARAAGVEIRPGTRAVSVAVEPAGFTVRARKVRLQAEVPGENGRILAAKKAKRGRDAVPQTIEEFVAHCRELVICTGGTTAAALLPGDVEQVRFQPVLGPLACDPEPLRGLDKLRAKCALTCNGVREEGEATFRTYGLSGIAAFNLSRIACPGDRLTIDFLPELEAESSVRRKAKGSGPSASVTQRFLERRLQTLGPCGWRRFYTGMLLPMVARAILRVAGLHEDGLVRESDLPAFGRALRAFPLTVRGIGDEKLAQVHRGGVCVQGVDPASMQVEGHPGLYVCGEAIDVDAPCGGYNLHWAWVSGILAGKAVCRR